MIDLKLEVKNYIIENLLRTVNDKGSNGSKSAKLKGLILDQSSTKVIASCFTMDELAAEGITFIDSVEKHRESYPTMEGVYLLTPTDNNILDIISDVQNEFYERFHIFFTEACPEGLIEKLTKKIANDLDKVQSLAELNTNFLPVEKQLFILAEKKMGEKVFKAFYQPHSNKNGELGHQLVEMAEQLATLCSTLGECPTIRYWKDNEQNEMFASLVRSRIDEYKNDASDKTRWQGPTKQKAQLLILDRGFDTKTCLLHDLTYQAMAYDLLEGKNIDIDTHVFTKDTSEVDSKEQGGDGVLDDKDRIWVDLRHKHISKVLSSFDPYMKQIKEIEEKIKGGSDTKSLKVNLRQLPQHLKMKRDIGKHQLLAGKCFETFNSQLSKLCETEQNLATATDADGNNISNAKNPGYLKFNEAFVSCLLDTKMSTLDKIRLLMLYKQFKKGIPEEELKKYMSHANVPMEEKERILKLGHLNDSLVVPDARNKIEYKRKSQKAGEESLRHISRWTPVLKDVIEDLINNRLDKELFPFLNAAKDKELKPDVQSTRTGSPRPNTRVKEVPRIIVFFLGGLTYSECRVAYEVTQEQNNQWDVLIGGTQLITPKLFLENLSALDNFVPLTLVQREKNTKELRKTIKRTSTMRKTSTTSLKEKSGRKLSGSKVFK